MLVDRVWVFALAATAVSGLPFLQEDASRVEDDLGAFAAPADLNVETTSLDSPTLFRRSAAPAVNEPQNNEIPKDNPATPNEGNPPELRGQDRQPDPPRQGHVSQEELEKILEKAESERQLLLVGWWTDQCLRLDPSVSVDSQKH